MTIAAPSAASLTEKRSEFIAQLYPITDMDVFSSYLEETRAKHHKARHHVWAYRLREGECSRCSDDGEPQGTGGVPVLGVLQKHELTDVCCIVTRYFGGVLLGANGLTRAYRSAADLAVQTAQIQHFCEAAHLQLVVDYGSYGKVDYLLPEYEILRIRSDFKEQVTLEFDVKTEQFPRLMARLTELFNGAPKLTQLETHFVDFSGI